MLETQKHTSPMNLVEISRGWSMIATKLADGWHAGDCFYSKGRARGTESVSSIRLSPPRSLADHAWPTLEEAANAVREWLAAARPS